ncbi:hypothetical protein B0H19DRAFT_1249010 [Mycena capillaripes]|nr:hypothetical protein B0H19DRAFT_1249010 [Mycena capillaripes]
MTHLIVFDPTNATHNALIPSFADIHIACIEKDSTIATFMRISVGGSGLARKLMEKLEEEVKAHGQTLLLMFIIYNQGQYLTKDAADT